MNDDAISRQSNVQIVYLPTEGENGRPELENVFTKGPRIIEKIRKSMLEGGFHQDNL